MDARSCCGTQSKAAKTENKHSCHRWSILAALSDSEQRGRGGGRKKRRMGWSCISNTVGHLSIIKEKEEKQGFLWGRNAEEGRGAMMEAQQNAVKGK